jgi:hypothetical protein
VKTGPPPRAIRFRKKNIKAEAVARRREATEFCTTANVGAR